MLWGLIMTILTFLLVVVCILSIDMFADTAEDPDPSTQEGEVTPPDTEGEQNPNPNEGTQSGETDTPNPQQPDDTQTKQGYIISKSSQTTLIDKEFLNSEHAVLIDVSAREIVAGYEYDIPVAPASLTKMMTLLVACEMLSDAQLDEIITISATVVEQMQREGASGVGLSAGEELSVRDLLYAIALASDGIASNQLAIYLCGSEEAFVQKMNEKVEQMGLIGTHFKSCTGLDREGQHSTCRELASIMIAAYENEQVRELLSSKTYRTTTNVHPTGLTFHSTYFVRIVEDFRKAGIPSSPSTGTIVMAKTGMTDAAKYCLATCYERAIDGKLYIAVTAEAHTSLAYVNDYIMIYDEYIPR